MCLESQGCKPCKCHQCEFHGIHPWNSSWELLCSSSCVPRVRRHTRICASCSIHTVHGIWILNELWIAGLVCERELPVGHDSQISHWIIKCLLCLLESYLQFERAAQLCGITANVIIVTDCIGINLISLSDKLPLQCCAADWEVQGAN